MLDADSDADSKSSADNNTFTNGNNTNIIITDNSGALIATALSTLVMMESLKGDHNPEKVESLIANLTNSLGGLLQGENSNRQAILDAINSLNKK